MCCFWIKYFLNTNAGGRGTVLCQGKITNTVKNSKNMAIKNLTTHTTRTRLHFYNWPLFFYVIHTHTHSHIQVHTSRKCLFISFLCEMMKWKCFMPAWASSFVTTTIVTRIIYNIQLMDAVCACHHYNECKAFFHLCFVNVCT